MFSQNISFGKNMKQIRKYMYLKEIEQGQVKGSCLLQSSLTMHASEDALASEFEKY